MSMEIKFSNIEKFLKNVEKVMIEVDGEKDVIILTSVIRKDEIDMNDDDAYTCPHCGKKELTKQGYRFDVEGKRYSRVKCKACGKWSRSYVI